MLIWHQKETKSSILSILMRNNNLKIFWSEYYLNGLNNLSIKITKLGTTNSTYAEMQMRITIVILH